MASPGWPITIGSDGAEVGPAPFASIAVTVKVYEPPLVRPVMASVVALELNVCGVPGTPFSTGVTLYAFTGKFGFAGAADH